MIFKTNFLKKNTKIMSKANAISNIVREKAIGVLPIEVLDRDEKIKFSSPHVLVIVKALGTTCVMIIIDINIKENIANNSSNFLFLIFGFNSFSFSSILLYYITCTKT